MSTAFVAPARAGNQAPRPGDRAATAAAKTTAGRAA